VPRGYRELGFAKIDTARFQRRGFPEVIYAPSKTAQQLRGIVQEFLRTRQPLIVTCLTEKQATYLKGLYPSFFFHPVSKIGYMHKLPAQSRRFVAVVTAGTGDIPVAEQAAVSLKIMGNRVRRVFDVGVAGVHRLFAYKATLARASCVIVVAGMEGALASIVSGLVRCPVIAVPTSCGYGANFKGLSALLTMLTSCSPGIAVVNIDNGFGAGYFASLVNHMHR
jgi:hypothetical protein